MKKLFVKMAIAGTLAFVSCSNEMPVKPSNEATDLPASLFRSESEAVEIASETVSKLSGTRASSLGVREIERLQKKSTRAGENSNAGFYVVNFDEDNGYAVVSVDRSLPSVIAFSDEGNMNVSDTVYNDGLKAFLDYALSVPPEIPGNGTQIIPDSSIFILQPKPGDIGKAYINYIRKPMLPYPISHMKQSAPYNGQCPIDPFTGERSLAGCGPVAVGEVMAYYRYPNYFSWDNIYEKPGDYGSQRLLAFLGQDVMGASYSSSGTSVTIDKIKKAFHKCWYKDPIQVNGTEKLSEVLRNEGLAIAAGEDIHGSGNGHVFVIDGLLDYVLPKEVAYIDPNRGDRNLVRSFCHIVWGWGSVNNGWYSMGLNETFNTVDMTVGTPDPVNIHYIIGSYFHKFEIIPGH